jgi:hypothetical protein
MDTPAGPLINDENLIPMQIIGRCAVCSEVGTLEYRDQLVPVKDGERLISYRSVRCWCNRCRKLSEFLPIEVRKYSDKSLQVLKQAQDLAAGRAAIPPLDPPELDNKSGTPRDE